MLNATEMNIVIEMWLNQLGIEVNGRYVVPVERKARIEMYLILIHSLVDNFKYNEDELRGMVLHQITSASVNPKSPKANIWKQFAIKDYNEALDTYFSIKIGSAD